MQSSFTFDSNRLGPGLVYLPGKPCDSISSLVLKRSGMMPRVAGSLGELLNRTGAL